MKATDLLKMQHKDVRELFSKIEKTDDAAQKEELFEQLATNLVAHDAIEREIFYPACEEELGMSDLLGEAVVEHGLVEFALFTCDMQIETENFDHYVTVLKEVVEHHVKEEEDELFKKVVKAMTAERLEELGEQMEARFADALADDFRAPLRKNLEQVLSGEMEPKKAPAKKPAKKKPAAKKATTKARSTNGNARAH